MTYQQVLTYLDSLINYEKKDDFDYKTSLKLNRMMTFSKCLGDPQKEINAIHVGGTKGKGSVASFINSILMESNYKVGLYTSPHLVSFRERIRINGEPIGEDDIARIFGKMRHVIEDMASRDEKPTYFEICTMMAFICFAEKKVDFMILEVGMGGRLDATNIKDALISVITPISFDHVRHLGPKIEDIAFEKSGIIKDRKMTVVSPQPSEAFGVIKKIADQKKSHLFVIGKDTIFEKINSDFERQTFNLLTRYSEYGRLETRMLGDFQIENAATAITAVEALRSYDIFIDNEAISEGIKKARWPGRFEVLSKKPLIIVDGAQNGQSAKTLKTAILNNFHYGKLILILGVMRDKDIDAICSELSVITDYLIVTKSKSERALPADEMKNIFLSYKKVKSHITTTVGEAIDKAKLLASRDDLVLITGSLYVVGEAIEKLQYNK